MLLPDVARTDPADLGLRPPPRPKTPRPPESPGDLSRLDPFRQTVLGREIVPQLRGTLPAWLRGSLVRTAPYGFASGKYRAEHWFDGLAMNYAFRLGAGAPRFTARSLDCKLARAIADDASPTPAQFGTEMRRSFLRRLLSPIPPVTDNTNVNVLRMGPDLVAMTEGPAQLRIDPESLATLGPVVYDDAFSRHAAMLAHPHLDVERRMVVGLATEFGPSTKLTFYEHAPDSRTRKPFATWSTRRVPYVHSFGLSAKHVVLLDHPLRFSPLGMLWSNGGLASHFRWDDGPTRLVVLPRDGSPLREVEAPPMFVFHVANTYDDGDEIVMDVAAYPDATIVQDLSTRALARPDRVGLLQGKLLRLRIGRAGSARVEELSDQGMEFPSIAYGTRNGREHGAVWGSTVFPDASGRSFVVRTDARARSSVKFDEAGYVLGEPIFVRDPSRGEEEGVILVVGSHAENGGSCLFVLDATTLEPVARLTIDGLVPLGFHGSFVGDARSS